MSNLNTLENVCKLLHTHDSQPREHDSTCILTVKNVTHKSKCHKHVYCEGFNYEISTGTCFWKSDVDEQFSSEIEQPDPDYVCYIAERGV